MARAKVDGKQQYVALGNVADTKLADAKRDAGRVLDDMRNGRDPALERAGRLKAAAAGEVTIAALASRWMAEIVRPSGSRGPPRTTVASSTRRSARPSDTSQWRASLATT